LTLCAINTMSLTPKPIFTDLAHLVAVVSYCVDRYPLDPDDPANRDLSEEGWPASLWFANLTILADERIKTVLERDWPRFSGRHQPHSVRHSSGNWLWGVLRRRHDPPSYPVVDLPIHLLGDRKLSPVHRRLLNLAITYQVRLNLVTDYGSSMIHAPEVLVLMRGGVLVAADQLAELYPVDLAAGSKSMVATNGRDAWAQAIACLSRYPSHVADLQVGANARAHQHGSHMQLLLRRRPPLFATIAGRIRSRRVRP